MLYLSSAPLIHLIQVYYTVHTCSGDLGLSITAVQVDMGISGNGETYCC